MPPAKAPLQPSPKLQQILKDFQQIACMAGYVNHAYDLPQLRLFFTLYGRVLVADEAEGLVLLPKLQAWCDALSVRLREDSSSSIMPPQVQVSSPQILPDGRWCLVSTLNFNTKVTDMSYLKVRSAVLYAFQSAALLREKGFPPEGQDLLPPRSRMREEASEAIVTESVIQDSKETVPVSAPGAPMPISFPVTLAWSGNTLEPGFSRNAELRNEAKSPVPVSSAPPFGGDPARWNPEDLLAGALATCHMLVFLALAAKVRLAVTSYEDPVESFLETVDKGVHRVSEIRLRPVIRVAQGTDLAKVQDIFKKAHKYCVIANSLSTKVTWEPQIVEDPPSEAQQG